MSLIRSSSLWLEGFSQDLLTQLYITMKRLFVTLSLLAMTTLTACHSKDQSTNPLLEVSQLDYQAPPFDKIRPEHFLPAFEQGMKEQLIEIDSITNNPEAPTFENTRSLADSSTERARSSPPSQAQRQPMPSRRSKKRSPPSSQRTKMAFSSTTSSSLASRLSMRIAPSSPEKTCA